MAQNQGFNKKSRLKEICRTPLPVNEWYEIIGEKTVADAIMDRLVHSAQRIELTGESMRRKRSKNLIEN